MDFLFLFITFIFDSYVVWGDVRHINLDYDSINWESPINGRNRPLKSSQRINSGVENIIRAYMYFIFAKMRDCRNHCTHTDSPARAHAWNNPTKGDFPLSMSASDQAH